MNRFKVFLAAIVAVVAMPLAACSEEPAASSDAQKQQMEQVIRDYLINNPEVIIEALDAYQAKMEARARAGVQDTLSAMADELTRSPNDPVLGNPDGDVTMVEFFDYRCGFCKRVFADANTLVEKDGNIRFVLKEFPILGADSVFASQAAQAVWLFQPDKYQAFHGAMMTNRGDLGQDKVFALAAQSGVDVEALKGQIDDPKVMAALEATARQAEALNISGTPAFIIGDAIQPGAIPLDVMEQLVEAARN